MKDAVNYDCYLMIHDFSLLKDPAMLVVSNLYLVQIGITQTVLTNARNNAVAKIILVSKMARKPVTAFIQ